MNREDDHQLWDLLGKSARPEVSPFFSRNLLRRVRSGEAETGRRTRFLWRRILPASGLVAATAAIFIAYTVSFHPVASNDDDAVAKIDAQDYEVVADLDNLLAADDNSPWDDNTSL
jgi:hypothetical protein